MPVVSVSMPEELLERLDEFIEDHGYSGRSEAVREGARGLLTEVDGEADADEEVVCVISTMFDHGTDVETQLSELRHEHEDLVSSNVHSHAQEACLELYVVEGAVDEIGSFVARIRSVTGVQTVEHSFVTPDPFVAREASAD